MSYFPSHSGSFPPGALTALALRTNCTRLFLNCCNLQSTTFLKSMLNLRHLHLGDNRLRADSLDAIRKLSQLTVLNLGFYGLWLSE